MKMTFYKIECLTNLHVGSGDINYNIVDNEVEKDQVTGMPIIHASGVKGALRDFAEKELKMNKAEIDKIFGSSGDSSTSGEGTHKFFDAHLLARPMRVAGSNTLASLPVATVASINQFVEFISTFGYDKLNSATISDINFENAAFLTNAGNISIEGETTIKGDDKLFALKNIIGENYAIAKSFDGYDLPVIARNALDNGKSKNLWYEEVVPHGSIFYFAVMSSGEGASLDLDNKIIQFGGHSSIGCGFTKITKIGG